MKNPRALRTLLGSLAFCSGVLSEELPKAASPSVVQGNTAFAVDLYKKLKDQPGNLFFSPYSISTALAMTYAGARGETGAQMAKTLHFDLPQDKLHPAFARLQKELSEAKGCELAVANRLWGQKGFSFLDAFLGVTRDQYGAVLEPLDFKTDKEGARKTINAWVEKQTQAKIKDLLRPDILSEDTRLVLTNAIYFKGKWKSPFEGANTRAEAFLVSKDQRIEVSMMSQEGELGYAQWNGLQALELPYEGDTLSMVVLLPREADGLAALEAGLTEASLRGYLDGLHPTDVEASLPTFKMTSEFSLKDALSALGMPLPFNDEKADFSRMTGKRDLFISKIIHKAFIEVNEEGTEATVATAVDMDSAIGLPPQPKVFRADHPFLFLIRDRKSGAILFMGRVTDPTS